LAIPRHKLNIYGRANDERLNVGEFMDQDLAVVFRRPRFQSSPAMIAPKRSPEAAKSSLLDRLQVTDPTMLKIMHLIGDELESDGPACSLLLEQLVDLVFCTAFRLATDSTPHEALTRLRLDEARRLLTSSNRSISQIALAVRFQTPSAFAARFRKTVGLTPRAYRQSLGVRSHLSSGAGTALLQSLPHTTPSDYAPRSTNHGGHI
jgi:AraC-like DNA-binding protein